MNAKKSIVRYEPYYDEWISMEEDGEVFSIEFDENFREENYPDVRFVKPTYKVDNACSVPIVVQILLTRICNYRCKNCHVYNMERKDELTTEEVFKILDDCANAGVLFVRFSGGEATLRKDFVDIIKYARNLGLKCALLSSCKHFSKEQFEIFTELCYVQPHLDSVTEKIFNELTGGDNFRLFENNVKEMVKRGIRVNPAMTLQKENMGEMKDIISFCAEHNIPIKVSALHGSAKLDEEAWTDYYNNVVLPFQKSWNELQSFADEVQCKRVAFVEKEEFSDDVKDTMAVISPWGRSFIAIDCEGNIFPSSIQLSDELILGSLRKGDDLFEVWKDSEVLNTLRHLTKEKLGCGDCRMDCAYCNPFLTYSYYGEFGKVMPHNDCPHRNFFNGKS